MLYRSFQSQNFMDVYAKYFNKMLYGYVASSFTKKSPFLHLHRQPLWDCWSDSLRQYEELHDSKKNEGSIDKAYQL